MPTRLIEIGATPADTPRLRYGTDLTTSVPYVVLSHCWGGEVPLRLLKENVDAFRAGIEGDMPKTFADALEIVRRLGQRYLWIDSLCIIQDSTDDWQREAGLMERIYENAWFSLAATGAVNSFQGMFWQRDPTTIPPLEVRASWRSHQTAKYYCWDPDHWTKHVDDAPLLHRGWVTQERVLAPRILHFTKEQVFWECCSLRASETFPRGIPNNTSYKPSMETKQLATGLLPYRTPALQRLRLWQEHVRIYSDSGLTEPQKDKFLAISGIARKIGPPQDYAAGLWKSVLTHQLRWSTGSGCSRQREWRAPSWSWASIDGKVFLEIPYERYLENGNRIVFKVLDVDVELASADPFGPVLLGRLQVQASMLQAVASKSDAFAQGPGPVSVWLNDILGFVKLDVGAVGERETLYCMPLHMSPPHGHLAMYGIVLRPAGAKGEFERCGVFHISNVKPTDRWVEKASESLAKGVESEFIGPAVGESEGVLWKQYNLTLV
ncbi:hypothetical protein, variant [Verruconis gallopava]|nr:hypothetical protein, variant [Verruconis gallopava]KIW00559.1 hypothetical protein, variant [Verruconis gallopava]